MPSEASVKPPFVQAAAARTRVGPVRTSRGAGVPQSLGQGIWRVTAGYLRIMGRAFGVESGSIGAALLITVCGEVDILTVPEVVDHLNAAIVSGAKRVVVDCSDVRFMD